MDDIANAIDILQEMNVPQGQQAKVDAAIRSLKKAHKEAGHFQRNWKAYAGGAGALGVAGLGGLGAKYAYDRYMGKKNNPYIQVRGAGSPRLTPGKTVKDFANHTTSKFLHDNPQFIITRDPLPGEDPSKKYAAQRRRGRRVAKAGMPPRDPRTGRFLKRKRR